MRSKAEQVISPPEEYKSDEGEEDQDEVTKNYEISPEPAVFETTQIDDDEEADSEFVSVVRTKKKKNQRPISPEPVKTVQAEISNFTIRSERQDSDHKMLERKDMSPTKAPGTEDVRGYNAKPAPWAGYSPDRGEAMEEDFQQLSLTSNLPENEREHS